MDSHLRLHSCVEQKHRERDRMRGEGRGGRGGEEWRELITLALQSFLIFEDASSKYEALLSDRELTLLLCQVLLQLRERERGKGGIIERS